MNHFLVPIAIAIATMISSPLEICSSGVLSILALIRCSLTCCRCVVAVVACQLSPLEEGRHFISLMSHFKSNKASICT